MSTVTTLYKKPTVLKLLAERTVEHPSPVPSKSRGCPASCRGVVFPTGPSTVVASVTLSLRPHIWVTRVPSSEDPLLRRPKKGEE